MSQAREVNTEWEKPKDDPLEGLSQHEVHKLLEYRTQLLEELSVHYRALADAIYALPIHVVYRQHAFLFLDTAEGWAKKGIDNVWERPKAPVAEPVDPTPDGA